MRRAVWLVALALCLTGLWYGASTYRSALPDKIAKPLGLRTDITTIRAAQRPVLTNALAKEGLTFGAPVYIRIFKEEAELELWVEDRGRYRLFRSYPICNFSGALGPKLKEGDRQSPEGFYRVDKAALNPNSRFHLSFNLGFPNAFDQSHGRTGSFLMVHGDCLSIGCYAMTDPMIEEIYVLVEAALTQGQPNVPVHAFPFRMTDARLAAAEGSEWHAFWSELAPVHRAFETTRRVPITEVVQGQYRLK